QHGHRNKVTISIDEDFLKGETKAENPPAEKPEESTTTPAEDDQTGSPATYPLFTSFRPGKLV
ncbi:MAG: hypothetical protein ACOC10_05905, partial [Bacteroidota bacterium]